MGSPYISKNWGDIYKIQIAIATLNADRKCCFSDIKSNIQSKTHNLADHQIMRHYNHILYGLSLMIQLAEPLPYEDIIFL